jgi:protein-disulfide isomerase
MGDPALEKLVARDVKDGQEAGIRGVPTVFINGKPLKNHSVPGIEEMIAAELKKAGKPSQ